MTEGATVRYWLLCDGEQQENTPQEIEEALQHDLLEFSAEISRDKNISTELGMNVALRLEALLRSGAETITLKRESHG